LVERSPVTTMQEQQQRARAACSGKKIEALGRLAAVSDVDSSLDGGTGPVCPFLPAGADGRKIRHPHARVVLLVEVLALVRRPVTHTAADCMLNSAPTSRSESISACAAGLTPARERSVNPTMRCQEGAASCSADNRPARSSQNISSLGRKVTKLLC